MELWKANDEIHTTVRDLIGRNHPDLALIVDEIVVIFREKAPNSGGQILLGIPRRAPTLANVLSGEEYKFVLELGADAWENLTSHKKEALLDHLLTSCRCEEDPKSGEMKCTIARPDISAFRENIERYGMWFPVSEAEEEKGPSDADAAVVEAVRGE